MGTNRRSCRSDRRGRNQLIATNPKSGDVYRYEGIPDNGAPSADLRIRLW